MTLTDPLVFLFLLGLLQLIVVGLITWDLATTNRLQSRMTKVETLLEVSIVADVIHLKKRVEKLELAPRQYEKT